MLILSVELRFVIVTDGKLRAAVETTEAQSTTLCCPNGVLAEFVGLSFCRFLHLNGLHRTFLGAQPATDTSIFIYCKELGLTLVRQQLVCLPLFSQFRYIPRVNDKLFVSVASTSEH